MLYVYNVLGFHPNIPKSSRVAIFVFGNCGSGKTTFVEKLLHQHLLNFAWINSDQISLALTKDEATHDPRSRGMAWRRLLHIIDGSHNFIHDTSGYNWDKIGILVERCRKRNYDHIIFFHMELPIDEVITNNQGRKRVVPIDYIMQIEEQKNAIKKGLNSLKPDAYYSVEQIKFMYNGRNSPIYKFVEVANENNG